jgi:hypothetical protein
MTTLPPPEVSVETNTNGDGGKTGMAVTIKRDGKSRTYTNEDSTVSGAVKGVFEKFLADPRSGEFHK